MKQYRDMRAAIVNVTRAVLLGVVVAHSAMAQEVVNVYKDPAFNEQLSRILVVGVHEDRNVRGQFENGVARALRGAAAAGEPSLAHMSSVQPLAPDTLLAAAGRAQADAVMVTRVLSVQTENPGATTTFVEYFRAYAAYEDPLPVMTTHTVLVRTDLYSVETERLIWSVESTAFDKNNLFGVIDALARSLTEQLRADALIR